MKFAKKSKVILKVMPLFVLKDCQKIPAAHRMRKEVLVLAVPVRSTKRKLQRKVAASVVRAIPVASPGLSPIPFGVTNSSGILAHGFVPPRPQNQLLEKAFMGAMPVVMLTSTPLAGKVATRANSPNAESQERETSVHLTVKYPSKPVHKELKDDYAAIGKAIVYGSPQRIARAVLKTETLSKVYC